MHTTKQCRIFLVISLVICADFICAEFTEAQLKTAGKLLRKNCQPKTKTSDESIDNMKQGVWDDLPTTKCYAYCVMAFYRLVNKKGEFDEESAQAQLKELPAPRQKPAWESALRCKNACTDCTNKCDAAYAILKCFYFDNPENYFAP